MQDKQYSLFELNRQIRNIIKKGTEPAYWVRAEISEIKVNTSGHCYLELIEKDEKSDYPKARSRATIWATTYRMIRPYFELTAGTPLSAGIKILIKVTIEFHEIYGLSLNIVDIEPSYTVGEIAMKKQEIINRLTEEGVIGMNHELEFPMLPKRIAVISSKTAAGYGDFADQLINNAYGYRFYMKLIPAYMQGEEAENSVIEALEMIHRYVDFFDVVVIIRGGGAQADLAYFNNYRMALHVAQFPLPVLTGIGHEQDDTVVDLVAYQRLKTPTAVAEYLVSCFIDADEQLNLLAGDLKHHASSGISSEKEKIAGTGYRFSVAVRQVITRHGIRLDNEKIRLGHAAHELCAVGARNISESLKDMKIIIRRKYRDTGNKMEKLRNRMIQSVHSNTTHMQHQLQLLENRNRYLNPMEILKRGYSITRRNGLTIKDGNELLEGDLLETVFYKGKRKSRVVE